MDKEKIDDYYKCILPHLKRDLDYSRGERADWYFIRDGYYDSAYITYILKKLKKRFPTMEVVLHYTERGDEYCFLITDRKD